MPHFVSRERECQIILRWLDPTHECRCILLHGPPGIGKTALAIKVANDRRETDKNTMVVYVNCKYIYSADDFAEKVLVQIYHYPSNNPISGLKCGLDIAFHNFRPVSNLPYVSKLSEKVAANQLIDHMTTNDLHIPLQSAYKQNHSTESALLKVKNDILLNMEAQKGHFVSSP